MSTVYPGKITKVGERCEVLFAFDDGSKLWVHECSDDDIDARSYAALSWHLAGLRLCGDPVPLPVPPYSGADIFVGGDL